MRRFAPVRNTRADMIADHALPHSRRAWAWHFLRRRLCIARTSRALGILQDRESPLKLNSHYEAVTEVTEPILKKWKEEQPTLSLSRVRGHYHLTRLGAELVIACGYDDPETIKTLQRFWA